jgi:hypothetical protein
VHGNGATREDGYQILADGFVIQVGDDAAVIARLRAAMAGETPLEGLDEALIFDGAHWTAEGPNGALWVIRWHSGTGTVTAWRGARGRVSFRGTAADLPAARREALRIAKAISDGQTREN